jgi:hypothetical protein
MQTMIMQAIAEDRVKDMHAKAEVARLARRARRARRAQRAGAPRPRRIGVQPGRSSAAAANG